MKHLVCVMFTFLLCAAYAQAAEDYVIELKVRELTSPLVFSPDGKKIVEGCKDDSVRIWDAGTGTELHELEGHTEWLFSAAFSPDSKKIITASKDGIVRIWNTKSGKELQKLEGHTNFLLFAVFSPDGKKIVTAGADGTVRTWDVESGKELHKTEGKSPVFEILLSSDGKKIAIHWTNINDGFQIIDVDSGNTLKKWSVMWSAPTSIVAFSTNEVTAAIGNGESRIIWNVDSEGEEPEARHKSIGKILQEHPHRVLATKFFSSEKKVITVDENCMARIWDVESGRELQKLDGLMSEDNPAGNNKFANLAIMVSSDEKQIATANTNNSTTIQIWDRETGKILQTPTGYFVAFSPDGKKVISKSNSETFHIWDLEKMPPSLPAMRDF